MAWGIFPDQGLNPQLQHRQVDSSPLNHQGSPEAWLVKSPTLSTGGGSPGWTQPPLTSSKVRGLPCSHSEKESLFSQQVSETPPQVEGGGQCCCFSPRGLHLHGVGSYLFPAGDARRTNSPLVLWDHCSDGGMRPLSFLRGVSLLPNCPSLTPRCLYNSHFTKTVPILGKNLYFLSRWKASYMFVKSEVIPHRHRLLTIYRVEYILLRAPSEDLYSLCLAKVSIPSTSLCHVLSAAAGRWFVEVHLCPGWALSLLILHCFLLPRELSSIQSLPSPIQALFEYHFTEKSCSTTEIFHYFRILCYYKHTFSM